MFDTRQFEKINPQYFNIIMLSEHDVMVQSRNTGHYWHLYRRVRTLLQVVWSIKKHDKWQLENKYKRKTLEK